jgi:hypothetical protein
MPGINPGNQPARRKRPNRSSANIRNAVLLGKAMVMPELRFAPDSLVEGDGF